MNYRQRFAAKYKGNIIKATSKDSDWFIGADLDFDAMRTLLNRGCHIAQIAYIGDYFCVEFVNDEYDRQADAEKYKDMRQKWEKAFG